MLVAKLANPKFRRMLLIPFSSQTLSCHDPFSRQPAKEKSASRRLAIDAVELQLGGRLQEEARRRVRCLEAR